VESAFMDLDSLGPVNFNQTGLRIFWNIYELSGKNDYKGIINNSFKLDDDFEKFIHLTFKQI
jgi:hypothetical protein